MSLRRVVDQLTRLPRRTPGFRQRQFGPHTQGGLGHLDGCARVRADLPGELIRDRENVLTCFGERLDQSDVIGALRRYGTPGELQKVGLPFSGIRRERISS